MMHKLRTLNPGKTFIEAPTAGDSATCKSCAHCPWMAMNGLAGVAQVLETGANKVHIDPALSLRARLPSDRMQAFTSAHRNRQLTAGAGAAHRRGVKLARWAGSTGRVWSARAHLPWPAVLVPLSVGKGPAPKYSCFDSC